MMESAKISLDRGKRPRRFRWVRSGAPLLPAIIDRLKVSCPAPSERSGGAVFWHPRTGDAQGMDTRRYSISGSLGVKRANASRLGSNQTYKEV